MKKSLLIILSTIFLSSFYAQKTSISFQLNGKNSNTQIQDSLQLAKNPFAKFIGEWTLKDDNWTHNWGGKTESIKIKNHHTVSSQINTENSLLSIIDGPEPNGHIFWSYNPNTKEVFHLSSFGDIRAGNGKGTVNVNGDVKLKIRFEGEPKNTYRIYNYKWINKNEYFMKSVQFTNDNKPTGLFYEGTFIRIKKENNVKQEIKKILAVLDNYKISKEEQIKVYAKNVVHMAPNNNVIIGKENLLKYLQQQQNFGTSIMQHKIVELKEYDSIIVMRGSVTGTFYPKDNSKSVKFQTKNLFIFERIGNDLKIQKVIYNMSPIK